MRDGGDGWHRCAIYRRNVDTLQRPGLAGWRALWRGDG
jgi:hypothetical protein